MKRVLTLICAAAVVAAGFAIVPASGALAAEDEAYVNWPWMAGRMPNWDFGPPGQEGCVGRDLGEAESETGGLGAVGTQEPIVKSRIGC